MKENRVSRRRWSGKTTVAILVLIALLLIVVRNVEYANHGAKSTSSPGISPSNSSHGLLLRVSDGASRSVTTPVEGTNLDYSGLAEPYGDTSVMNAVNSLALGTIRYPGGTIANYWSWQTGTVNQPSSTTKTRFGTTKTQPSRHQTYGFTLSTLKQLTSATGAVPIFDLNVMTSTLQDQIQMLQSAVKLGLPVRYVELGNEFYLSNSNYLNAFPTATSYADLVASWAPAIRAEFPNVQIAAVASIAVATPREQSWNSTLLRIAGNDINAVTLHDYPGVSTSENTPHSPETLLAGASIEWQPVRTIINSFPPRLSVWLTEYNLGPGARSKGSPALGTTWEHALYMAGLEMQMLASTRVTITDYWDLFGNTEDAQFAETLPITTTPTGSASQLINQAIKGANGITVLNITNDPPLDGSVKSVSGIKVTTASGLEKLIFANLGSSSVTLAGGNLVPAGASAEQLSGSLSIQALNVQSIHISNHLDLPPNSVTVVTV
ncbi:hypothetical protein [Acidithrix ferrooxidans]|uniref:Exo-alpha-(1->6)-L-arabinofuranosidase n=1 Tax=Acidithrix ferrooxidans TaxID=1280514 RepID=A0A0D8HCG6_9ACTN|nr:hypothetical protein [Acidithrix ferrooxidans]KJF15660.1 Exo-alpha-(1->6)-L-arabinofuranosidase [Acidithrix ferrooxidans]